MISDMTYSARKHSHEQVFFTGDHHFGHENIIKYANRPFSSAVEMDNSMISAWNSVIDENCIVVHVGDFTLGDRDVAFDYFEQLRGEIWVIGTPWHHDKRWIEGDLGYYGYSYLSKSGVPVLMLPSLSVIKIPYVLDDRFETVDIVTACHYPLASWERSHYDQLHVHGHSHNMTPKIANRLDVGVDSAFARLGAYRPFSLLEVINFARRDE